MKIKQKTGLLLGPLLIISMLSAALASPPSDAEALTEAQNKKCFQDWASSNPGQSKINKLKQSNCYKNDGSGRCKIEEERGNTRILCKRSDGTFATTGNYKVNEDPADETTEETEETEETPTEIANPVEGDDCGGVDTAIIKCDPSADGSTQENGIWKLLLIALNILTAGVGIAAVGGIVYGAILYTTAEDKADQVKKATDIITNVVIGLVLFAFMYAGLQYIVPGGVFS